jgi:predicted transcriptional regulator
MTAVIGGMKVAISVPDRVHRAADRAARRMRVPRSRIYVRALEAYLAATSEEEITRQLDAVYGSEYGSEAGPADPFLAAASRATLRRSR